MNPIAEKALDRSSRERLDHDIDPNATVIDVTTIL